MLFALLCGAMAGGLSLLLNLGPTAAIGAYVLGMVGSSLLNFSDLLLLRLFFSSMLYIFFREIDSRNSHWVPAKGPLIVFCAPHANQFIDPILVMTSVRRPIRFLTAAVSMRRPFVGMLARNMNSIPVERPQDIAKSCQGKVTAEADKISGQGTRFLTEVQVDTQIYAAGVTLGTVAEIISDTELRLARSTEEALTQPTSFKVAPKIDHSHFYKEVYSVLKKGGCVGIFPEGGSHDNSSLLPFKAGLAVLALGAMAEGSPPVRLVPVGLNYFHGHRFRGRALLDFGEPLTVSPDLLEAYKRGGEARRQACNDLLATAQRALEAVIVSAPDYDTLKLLWATRRLYKPEHLQLSLDQTHKLTQRFAEAYTALADRPGVQKLRQEVELYNHQLETFGLRDHQVVVTSNRSTAKIVWRLFQVSVVAVIESILLLPFIVLGIPILSTCRIVAHSKAKAAVAKSSVKQKGLDVVGTWKLLTSLIVVPITFAIYGVLASWLLGLRLGMAVWLLLPFLMLASLRLWDHYLKVLRAFWGALFALRHPEQGSQLYNMRKKLKHDIRKLTSETAAQLGIDRMFSDADFAGEEE